jgi:hypothetical protein
MISYLFTHTFSYKLAHMISYLFTHTFSHLLSPKSSYDLMWFHMGFHVIKCVKFMWFNAWNSCDFMSEIPWEIICNHMRLFQPGVTVWIHQWTEYSEAKHVILINFKYWIVIVHILFRIHCGNIRQTVVLVP